MFPIGERGDFFLPAHAGSHSEGGGDGGEYGNHDVQDLAPECFVHFLERLKVKGERLKVMGCVLHHRVHRVSLNF